MNRFLQSMLLAAMLAVPVAQAADPEDHAAHHADADRQQADSAPGDKATGMKMEKMQEQMKKMREQMDRIHAAKDPQERQKLMTEHMQSMRDSMNTMHAMGGGMMGKKGEPMMEGSGDSGGAPMGKMMMKRHKMMEDRMDMMQMMLEQMMEHESAEQKMERGG